MESSPKCDVEINLADVARLRPITPIQTSRYSKPGGVSLSCRKIPAGCFSRQSEPEPLYLPSGWTNHVQAEGQPYFFHREARFVTEADLYNPEKFMCISFWMVAARKLAEVQRISITDSMEIMLQLDEDDPSSCGYYVADHESESVFWFQEVTSEELQILDSVSMSQLRWMSNEFFWTHIEIFSAHFTGIRMSRVRELYSIMSHARADHLTSTVGTFPYTAEQCKDFLGLLRDHVTSSSEILSDKYIICVVARLWAQVAHHRFINFYGEDCARLSRDQRVTNLAPQRLPLLLNAFSKSVLFDIPRQYASELEGLWVDNQVYSELWKTFVNRLIDDWRETALWTAGLTSMHAVLLFLSMGSSNISVMALVLSIFGFISSMALANYHRLSMEYDVLEAASYLSRTCHSRYGFSPLSLVYSIPKALLYWSASLMIFQGAFSMFEVLPISNPIVAGSVVGLTVAVLLSVAYVLRLQTGLSSWISCLLPISHHGEDLEKNDGTVDDAC